MMQKYYFILFCLFPLISCSQNKKVESEPIKIEAPIINQNFTTLKFEANGKPCLASINDRYIDFKDRSSFSLSFFVNVNTLEKNKDGHPTDKEALLFNNLQTEIIQELSKVLGSYCYVGTTTMTGYRDILLYIKPEDQKNATEILERLKTQQSRIESISFEIDPKWEAVSSFYEAVTIKN
ncbi:DUF695 domain-containing protein [Daejeonella rubra]|nr:DUF695 domain-containing protein [Daejeonella rubra]